jgi:hypothetical protein
VRLPAAFSAFLIVLASAADASCVLTLRHEEGEIRWNAVPGALRYQVQESFNEYTTSRNVFTEKQSFRIAHRVTAPTAVYYLVTAEVSTAVQALAGEPSMAACTGRIAIELQPDPALRTLTRRIVFPLVGSTPGAFGGRFKTSLKLTASNANQKGTLVFHPAGKPASDSDPSMPFALAAGETRLIDDIVAAMGQSGIGSLDIIPDENGDPIVPVAEARLYNDTAAGTFGTHAMPIYPAEYLRPAGMKLSPTDSRFRINVGFRTFTDTAITILINGTDGRLRDFREARFSAGWMQMTTLSELAGSEIKEGEAVTLLFSGAVVPFYTVTENRTNDPMLIVGEPVSRSLNVGRYVD